MLVGGKDGADLEVGVRGAVAGVAFLDERNNRSFDFFLARRAAK
jgi:hypothetical protein